MKRLFMAVFLLGFSPQAWAEAEGYFAINMGVQNVHLAYFEPRFSFGVDGGSRFAERFGYAVQYQNAASTLLDEADSTHSLLGAAGHWFLMPTVSRNFYIGPNFGFAFETIEVNAVKASEAEPYVGLQTGWTYRINDRFATGLELRWNRVLGDPKPYSITSLLSTLRILF